MFDKIPDRRIAQLCYNIHEAMPGSKEIQKYYKLLAEILAQGAWFTCEICDRVSTNGRLLLPRLIPMFMNRTARIACPECFAGRVQVFTVPITGTRDTRIPMMSALVLRAHMGKPGDSYAQFECINVSADEIRVANDGIHYKLRPSDLETPQFPHGHVTLRFHLCTRDLDSSVLKNPLDQMKLDWQEHGEPDQFVDEQFEGVTYDLYLFAMPNVLTHKEEIFRILRNLKPGLRDGDIECTALYDYFDGRRRYRIFNYKKNKEYVIWRQHPCRTYIPPS